MVRWLFCGYNIGCSGHDNWTKNGRWYKYGSTALRPRELLSSGSRVRILPGTPPMLPRCCLPLTCQTYIGERKATKGLTAKGERWLRQTLLKFAAAYNLPLSAITTDHVAQYLARWNAKPWSKHSQYRALRVIWRWTALRYGVPNPMAGLRAPTLPAPVLYRMTSDKVARLISAATEVRDKALIALLADSGLQLIDKSIRSHTIGVWPEEDSN